MDENVDLIRLSLRPMKRCCDNMHRAERASGLVPSDAKSGNLLVIFLETSEPIGQQRGSFTIGVVGADDCHPVSTRAWQVQPRESQSRVAHRAPYYGCFACFSS